MDMPWHRRAAARTALPPIAAASRWPRRWVKLITASPTSRRSGSRTPSCAPCTSACASSRSRRRGSRPFSLCHWQSPRRFEMLPRIVRALCKGKRAALGSSRMGPVGNTALVQRSKATVHARSFSRARQGFGAPAPDPIFIVGLPRAGSTLLEQILASHSPRRRHHGAARHHGHGGDARQPARRPGLAYPAALAQLSAGDCRALGEQYLAQTRIQRKTAKPFFIDKMPNNFLHIGLIRLILPNAKIIDARRHPMACCFSAFKQNFAQGQRYSYSLENLARYYRDYVDLMAHFDRVAPGAIHRVIYEDLVDDTAGESRVCWLFADCRSSRPSWLSTKTTGQCGPQARNRCASRSSGRVWISGETTRPGSSRCGFRWPMCSSRIRAYRPCRPPTAPDRPRERLSRRTILKAPPLWHTRGGSRHKT